MCSPRSRIRCADGFSIWSARAGPVSASALAGELPVSRQAIVKHLAVLEKAELVASERSGRENCFSVRSDALDATATWMASLASQWDQRLAAAQEDR